MTHMKMRLSRTYGDNISATVFLGPKGQTLQNAGELIMGVGEYQLMAAALAMGAKATNGHLLFQVEGEKAALATPPKGDE